MKRWIWGLCALSLGLAAAPVRADCDSCEALCWLMDRYDQRQKGVDIWYRWASSNPNREAPPAGVTESGSMEAKFQEEFDQALSARSLPCPLPLVEGIKRALGFGDGSQVELETGIGQSCAISWKGQDLAAGDTQQRWEASIGCKKLSDPLLEHERAHQSFCQEAWAKRGAKGGDWLDEPATTAENEWKAWTREKDLLEQEIRELIEKYGCGWEPTTRQIETPGSIPSVTQVQKMKKRAWQTTQELEPVPSVTPGRRQ
jgi:hypothetical protein